MLSAYFWLGMAWLGGLLDPVVGVLPPAELDFELELQAASINPAIAPITNKLRDLLIRDLPWPNRNSRRPPLAVVSGHPRGLIPREG